MRLTPLALLFLSACTTTGTFTAAPQQYREPNSEKLVSITGKLDQKLKQGVLTNELESRLIVYIDGQPYIQGDLDQYVSGELTGRPYNNKTTSASCSSKMIDAQNNIAETRCIIFINNERVATLTM